MKEGATSCDCDKGYYRSETDPAAMPCTRESNISIHTSLKWVYRVFGYCGGDLHGYVSDFFNVYFNISMNIFYFTVSI